MKSGFLAALVSALLLTTATVVAGQQPVSNPPPLPPAPASLSVPNPLAGLQPGARDLYRSPDGSDRFQRLSPHPARRVVIVPGGFFPGPYYVPVAGMPSYRIAGARAFVASGGLVLETVPSFAQVHVDDFYLGLAEEFGLRGRALDLPAGAHRVELRAPGYETLRFSVMIAPNEILRYRGDMQLLSAPQPVRIAERTAVQKSFYVIPHCYAGDKPPMKTLPRGCEIKNLQTRK